MFKRSILVFFYLFWSAHCSDDDDLLSILAQGGEEEKVTLSASQVNEKTRQTQVEASAPLEAPSRVKRADTKNGVESKPITCKFKKYKYLYYFGTLITVNRDIESAELCGSVCWNYGKRCESVNYISASRSCELLQGLLDVKNTSALKHNAEQKYDSVYVIPLTCAEGARTSTAERSLTGPGSCGQTFVEPRIPAAALTRRTGQRIVGGTEVKPHSLPWQVSLRQGFSGIFVYHFCGGTLIRADDNRDESDIVITAAHCLYEKPRNLQVVAGSHSVYKAADGEQRVSAGNYVVHPEYNEQTMVNDIAIIKLDKPVKFSRTIQPACLPSPGERVADKTPGLVSGWGRLAEYGSTAAVLMQVVLPTIDSEACIPNYKTGDDPVDIVPELMLCAGYAKGGKDACQGDSGGPLVFQTSRGFVLQGVVSFGEGCARAGKPGIYARVSSYIEWIQQNIRKLSALKN